MAEQIKSLSVRAVLASEDYVAGAKAIASANREMSQSTTAVGQALTQTDSRISNAASGVTRLVRAYDQVGAAQQRAERDLMNLSRAFERGQVSAEQATRIYTGMVGKLGVMVDETSTSLGAMGAIVAASNERIRAQAVAVNQLADAYRSMAAEARAAQAADVAQASFNRSFGIDQPARSSAAASASVFEIELRRQEEEARRMEDLNRMRAQQEGANFAARTNALLGVGGYGTDARASAGVFEEAAREAEMYAQKAAKLRATLDPVWAAQQRLNAEMAECLVLFERGEISAEEFARAEGMLRSRHDQLVASLNRTAANDNMMGRDAMFRRQNLAYQAFDVGQGLASGMPTGMIAAQQLPQIVQLYVGQGGLKAAMEDANAALAAMGTLARSAYAAIGPLGLAFGAAATAVGGFFLLTRSQTKTTDELLKEHVENVKALGEAYGFAEEKARKYLEADRAIALAKTRTTSDELQERVGPEIDVLFRRFGTPVQSMLGPTKFNISGIYAPFEEAFARLRRTADPAAFVREIDEIGRAKGLEHLSRQIITATENLAGLKEQIEAADSALQRARWPNLTARTDEARAMQEARIRAADEMTAARRAHEATMAGIGARTPAQLAAAARDRVMVEPFNPQEDRAVREYRANAAAAEAYAQAELDLKRAQEDRQRQQQASLDLARFEASIAGETIEVQTRLRAEYEAMARVKEAAAAAGIEADQRELDVARRKAAEIAHLNQQATAGRLLRDQQSQIEALRLEASLIGAGAAARARATAALQAEQQLRQAGINLLSAEAQAYRANAVAMADARLELERQQAAYGSLQQAGSSAIDALVTGTGSLKDRLRSVMESFSKWLLELSVSNPLKNALFGTNLPTMQDLMAGKPVVPGVSAMTTGSMTVSAGTVMINGVPVGMPGAVPGIGQPGATTTLLDFLKTPAVNGVRPDLTPSGIVNSPVAMAARQTSATGVEAEVWNYWAQKGLQPHQIAGIMGNIKAESNFNPAVDWGDGGKAWGLAQWNDRRDAMVRFVGPDWRTNVRGQMDFMHHEFQTTEAASWARLRQATDVRSATAAMAGYERPRGYSVANPESAHNFAGRLAGAESALAKFGRTTATVTPDVSSLGDASTKTASTITDTLGKLAQPGGAITAVQPQITAAAPSGGGLFSGLFSAIGGLFGGFFADGTDFARGGLSVVGERGPELVRLPRGSRVIPNHQIESWKDGRWQSGKQGVDVKVEVSVRDGNIQAYVTQVAEKMVSSRVPAYLDTYSRDVLPNEIDRYSRDPYARGGR